MALPNGLPTIVSFLAASIAGTAAPLNPGYKEDEFRVLPRRHQRQSSPAAARGRRRGAARRGDRVPDPDASTWTRPARCVSAARRPRGSRSMPPAVDDVALILHTSGSTGRPKRVPLVAREPVDLGAERRAKLRARSDGRLDVRDAALPRARPGRVDAGDARDRRHRRRAGQVQPAVVLAHRARSRRDVVLGGADDAPVAARAGRAGRGATRRRGEAAVHPIVQRVAAAAGDARSRSRLRRAGARGVRHDGSRASDGVQPAAAGARASRDRSGAGPTSASASWTATAGISPRASAAKSSFRGRTSFAATRTTRRPTRRRSPTAGSGPATRAFSTPTAT